MNHQYRVIWNTRTQSLQAVAETATAHGKGHSIARAARSPDPARPPAPGLQALALTLATAWLGLAPAAWAGPQGGVVTAGSASISASGNATTINQSSHKAAIDWNSFSVGQAESVRFNQPASSSVTLNRVTGLESSRILGNISANGQVFILNPNGMLVGNGAQISTGGFVASTLGMRNDDFMAGRYQLTAAPGMAANASIRNQGTISLADGGSIVLIAPLVSNTGTLNAPRGTVLMAAAKQVTLTLRDNSSLSYTLDQGSLQAMVDNGGLIQAPGGHVVLTAKGLDALTKASVNHSGVIEAQTVQEKAGVVELLADMQGGQVTLAGRIDASAPNGGNGGFVETSAAKVKVEDSARVTTLAAQGKVGTWLIDPTDFNVGGPNADISASAASANLATSDFSIFALGSDISINDPVSWSAHTFGLTAGGNINVKASLNGGAAGKLALQYGQSALAAGNTADYHLNNGATVTLAAGPNFSTKLGSDGTVRNYTVITRLGIAGDATTTTLQGMKNNRAGNYALGANVDASATSGWNAGVGFQPVGDYGTYYSGTFAGLGHSVSNLAIHSTAAEAAGLFGVASANAALRDVGLPLVNISSQDGRVGALAGYNFGTVSNSYSSGQVIGTYSVGGLVGRNDGKVSNSYSASSTFGVTVVGSPSNYNVGGLVGINAGTVINSYSTGATSADDLVGGLIGSNLGGLSNSYSTGSVTGNTHAGGLSGLNNGTVNNSYWDKNTSGQAASAGGTGLTTAQMHQASNFAGWSMDNVGGQSTVWRIYEGQAAPLLKSYLKPATVLPTYDGTQTHMANIADFTAVGNPVDTSHVFGGLLLASNGVAGQSTASLRAYSDQQGYDIMSLSRTLGGTSNAANDVAVDRALSWDSGQLILSAQNTIDIYASLNGGAAGKLALESGQGAVGSTADYALHKGTSVSLAAGQNFQTKRGSDGTVRNYTVITSLGAAGDATTTTLQGMKNNLAGNYALGANVDASATSGWNLGAGFKPVGDYATDYSGTFAGLGHTISNLAIHSIAAQPVGLFGQTQANAEVRDVGLSRVDISSKDGRVGALAGYNYGKISNSYSTGDVSGIFSVGGLVGRNEGVISNSYSGGVTSGITVVGTPSNYNVGGLVGINAGTVSNSYGTGAVTGDTTVGGLVGYNSGPTGVISSSYSTGSVDGDITVGGLVGSNDGAVNNSYWDKNTSFRATSAGGTGLTTAQMHQASSFAGWSLDSVGGQNNVWRIYEGQTAPLLKSFMPSVNVTVNNDASVHTYSGLKQTSTAGYALDGGADASKVLGTLTDGGIHANTYTISMNGLYSSQTGYDLVLAHTGQMTIGKAHLTVTPTNQTRLYGQANPTFTETVSGYVNGETLATSGVTGSATGSSTATPSTAVGTAVITGSTAGLSASNYDFTAANGTLTINKAHLTVTADNQTRMYGQANPTFTETISGFANGETLATSGVSGTATGSSAATPSTAVGTATITGSTAGLSAGNYDFTAANGTLTINKAHLTVTADDKSRLYGEANPAFSETISGYANGETLATSGVTGTATGSSTANASTGVGTTTITGSTTGLSASNYDFTAANGTLTINKRPLTVTAQDKSKTYGDANPPLTYTVAADGVGTSRGLVNGDTLSGSLSTHATTTSGISTPSNIYTIDASALANGNYLITANNGVLTINKRPVTAKADDKTKSYGDPNPVLTYTAAADGVGTSRGLVNGDTLSGNLTTNATTNSGISTPSNTYTIDASALANGNYLVTALNGVLTITPRNITINADAKAKIAGNPDPLLTWALATGSTLVGNDSLAGSLTRAPGETIVGSPYAISQGTLGSGISGVNYSVHFHGNKLTILNATPTTSELIRVTPLLQDPLQSTSDVTLQVQGTGIRMPAPDDQLSAL